MILFHQIIARLMSTGVSQRLAALGSLLQLNMRCKFDGQRCVVPVNELIICLPVQYVLRSFLNWQV